MKKILACILIAATLLLSFSACGEGGCSPSFEDKHNHRSGNGSGNNGSHTDGNESEADNCHVHNFGQWTITKKSTCVEKGSQKRTCKDCNKVQTEELPLNSHEFITDISIPDCGGNVAEVISVKICLNCALVEKLPNQPAIIHPHSFVRREPVEPTCTTQGVKTWFECEKCGYDVKKTIASLGHLTNGVVYEETNNDSSHYMICQRSNCNEKVYEVHVYSWTVTKSPSCTVAGQMKGVCKKCSHVYYTDISPAHKYDSGTVTKKPSCTESGNRLLTCTVCGHQTNTPVPPLGHDIQNHTLTNNPDNPCEHVGTCSRCGATDYKTIHKEVLGKVLKEPTCTESGKQTYSCERCSAKGEKTISPLGHAYEIVNSKSATCTENGYTIRICTRCNEIDYDLFKALGHNLEKKHDNDMHWDYCNRCSKDLDCSTHTIEILLKKEQNPAKTTYIYSLYHDCISCEYSKKISEVAHVHDQAEIIEATPPTCTKDGYLDGLKCKSCSEVLIPCKPTQALGHKYVNKVCVRCGNLQLESRGLEYTNKGDYYIVNGIGSCTDTDICIPEKYNNLPVTEIAYGAFAECTKLTSVTIPNSVTIIEDEAFRGCYGLTSVTIGNSVTSIGMLAFWACHGLTSITISNSVRNIGGGAFWECEGLTSVTIGNSVTRIEGMAFANCYSLTSITIPSSVTSIGFGAFEDCTGLTTITFQGTTSQWENIAKDKYWNSGTGDYVVKCTDGTISKADDN